MPITLVFHGQPKSNRCIFMRMKIFLRTTPGLALLLVLACSTSCRNRLSCPANHAAAINPTAKQDPPAKQETPSQPQNNTTSPQPASEKAHFLEPGFELIAMLPSVLREVEFVTNSSRFLMYRSRPTDPFRIYTEKGGQLIETKGDKAKNITKTVLNWFVSIKIEKQLPPLPDSADPEDNNEWFEKGEGAYLLYRTFMEEGYAQMLNIGNRTKEGEYYVNHPGDASVFLIKGHVIDQMRSF